MADSCPGLDCLTDDIDIKLPFSGPCDGNGLESANSELPHGETSNIQQSNVQNFFFPCLDSLNESCGQMTDLTNSLPRDSANCAVVLSDTLLGISSGRVDSNFHSLGQIDQQKSIDNGIFNNSYENAQHYHPTNSSSGNSKPLEPTDVYGRVSCIGDKIVLQLRLINLNTNFPINVSECWLCRSKVHGSSPLYSHKHTFSGVFQVNDEYVNLTIDQNNLDHSFGNKSSDEEIPHPDNFTENINEFSINSSSQLSDNLNSSNNDISCVLPYASQEFLLSEKLGNSDTSLMSAPWNQSKPYHSGNYNQSSSGYNIHCAVDNIYNKTNYTTLSKVSRNSKVSKINSSKETGGLILHTLDSIKNKSKNVSDSENVTRKTETGARKRKSKAQKKLSVIRMKYENNQPEDYGNDWGESSSNRLSYNCSTKTESPEINSKPRNVPSFSPNCVDSNLLKNSQKQLDCNYNLVKHILEKTEILVCKFCNRNFHRNFSEYSKHLVEDHSQSSKHIFECPVCLVKFSRNKYLVQHVKTHLGVKAFKCDQCGTTYGREESLKRHLMNHSGKKPHSCSICPKTFSRSEYLNAHMLAHSRSKHVCEKCGKVCSSKFNLSVHLKIHSDVKPFVCELCNKSFVRNDFLDNHMEVVHKKNKPKCSTCGKVFSRLDVLKRHEKMHRNISYDCKFCLKSFSRKDRLLIHKRTHGINSVLKCSKCPATFRRKDVLQKHEKLHQLKHQCRICYKFTSSKEKLSVHLNWHEKEKNDLNKDVPKIIRKCDHCDKTFLRKDLLTKHIKKMHPTVSLTDSKCPTVPRQKNFTCDICSKGFTRSCNLRTHVLKIHTVSAARKQKNTENVSEYNEEYDEDDPDGIDQLNSALHKSRHSQNHNLVDLSTWTSNRQNSLESVIRHHSGHFSNSPLAVSNSNDVRESWYPRAHSVSPPPSLASGLSLPQLSSQHPHSPINLSAEAITAAAYLLAYPSYLGPYQ